MDIFFEGQILRAKEWQRKLRYLNKKNFIELNLGLGTEYCSEKKSAEQSRNGFRYFRKKVFIPRHSEFWGRPIPKLGTERNGILRKKIVYKTAEN